MSERIPVTAPDGTPGTIDAAELESALAHGFKQPSTVGDVLDTGRAALIGGVRGAFPGAVGVMGGSTEAPNRSVAADIARTQAEHPIATGVGELGGALLSPLNKAGGPIEGAVAPTTVIGRIGAKALGGAAVGGLYGAGNAVDEASLGDTELTAQKLASSVGLGGLLGLAGGGVGGALEEAVAPLKSLLANALEEAPEKLQSFADERWNKAGGALKEDLRKLSPEKRGAVADVFRQHFPDNGSLPETFESMERAREGVGQRIGVLSAAPDAMGAKLQPWDSTGFLGELNPTEQRVIQPEVETLQKDMARAGTFSGAHDVLGTLGERANWKYAPDADPVKNRLMKALYGSARKDWEAQLEPHIGPDLSQEFRGANQQYSNLSSALGIARHGLDQMGGNSFLSLRDRLSSMVGVYVGATIGGPVGAGVGYLASGVISKLVRERGSALVARLADSIAESPVLASVAEGLRASLARNPAALGSYAPMLAAAAASSAPRLLATHMALASSDPDYSRQAKVAGLTPESPGQTQAALQKAHGLATLAASNMAHDADMARAADSALKGGGAPPSPRTALNSQDFGNRRMRRDDTAAHQQLIDEVHSLAADPGALVDRIAGNTQQLGQIAPGVTAHLAKTAAAGVQYLASLAPKPPRGPLALPWVYSDEDKHKFLEAYQVIQEPQSLLRHVAAGTLTQGQISALRAYAPKLEQDMQTKVLTAVTDGRKVPYAQRLMVGVWTGQDLDGTMSPGAVLGNQVAIKAPTRKSEAPKPTAQGMSKLSVAERTAMPDRPREAEA